MTTLCRHAISIEPVSNLHSAADSSMGCPGHTLLEGSPLRSCQPGCVARPKTRSSRLVSLLHHALLLRSGKSASAQARGECGNVQRDHTHILSTSALSNGATEAAPALFTSVTARVCAPTDGPDAGSGSHKQAHYRQCSGQTLDYNKKGGSLYWQDQHV